MNFFLQVFILAAGLAVGSAAVINPPNVCSSYVKLLKAYTACNAEVNDSFLESPLSYAENMCSNRTLIKTCMLIKVLGCPNQNKIMTGVDVTFNKCNGFEVKPALQQYLGNYVQDPKECTKSYNFSSASACMGTSDILPTLIESSYSDGATALQSVLDLAPVCLEDFLALDPVPGCNGKSGYDLYVDTLALTSALYILGVDVYQKFELAAQFLG